MKAPLRLLPFKSASKLQAFAHVRAERQEMAFVPELKNI
jgi:hypothetical protein